jgi:aspartate kinase
MAQNKRETLVMKFGGTSVGTPEAIRHGLEIVRQAQKEWKHVVVVSSAFSQVTDALYQSAVQASRGNLAIFDQTFQMLKNRHFLAVEELVHEDSLKLQTLSTITELLTLFSSLVQAISVLGEASPRALDTVVSMGERLAVTVLAAVFFDAGIKTQAVDACQIIVTDNQFQNAAPLFNLTLAKVQTSLLPLLEAGFVPVVTGFLGATEEGIRTTLGRGGSDYSAAVLGVVLGAGEVWIWTDVNGVMTADPRLARDAETIPVLSYREVSELAYFGAKVLHPKTIRPVVEAGIPLRVLNTFDRTKPGTLIQEQLSEKEIEISANSTIIKAVTAIKGVQLITVEGRGMLGVPGVAARIFSAVATTGATVPLITEASSEQSLCFAVPVEMAACVIEVLEKTLADEIIRRNIDRIWASEEVVIVTAVCPHMRHKLGVAGKVFSALADHEVNVLAIAHGSSEVSISLVVATQDLEITIKALHGLTR